MRLYSTRDLAQLLAQALTEKAFTIDNAKTNSFEAVQKSGIVSQRFTIMVDTKDEEPV
ncbi:hypothetical protein [Bradyrhizobium erythrophlei]|uniref:Uncharacterized protein n=1 Tax=Bradyrhizobium erythrophlei TaxID=1437360 RepID=A0A1M5PS28_9BRAD|nr:hypothetical protein [Bradyrhizobium erythrophlei]SHH04707.1 hypothetical protein SAMN05443248_3491 [Bradyrhizobium erythrophlei]